MHPFQAGDLVLCVDDTPNPGRIIRRGEPWIKRGRAYRISATLTNEIGQYGVTLVGLEHWPPAAGWHAWRFEKFEPASKGFQVTVSRTLELA